jgi:hypothetical protein
MIVKMEREILPSCKERFDSIYERLEKGDDESREHGEKIIKVETNVDNLTKSLNGVTRALWGVASAIGMTLLGFIIWFIQTK